MSALSENRSVRQRPEEGFRRWFVNEYFDIIVWYESRRTPPTGFQLCYDRHANERAFTWQRGKQSSHFVSDQPHGERTAWAATAILHGDAGPIPASVLKRLEEEQGELDGALRELIVTTAREYNRRYEE
ncbi:MAG: hypothetical protein ACOCYB_06105 [Alkalispirochaeta sp.]